MTADDDAPLSDLGDSVRDDGDDRTRETDDRRSATPDEPVPSDATETTDSTGDARDSSDGTADAPGRSSEGNPTAARRDDAPLSDLARRVERRRSDAADRDDASSLFESVSVDEVDSETLWTELVDGGAAVGVGASVESVDEGASRYEDHVVPKHEFCQQCPHFADPPELACTHEGTDIVEVVETDRFRVRNCPMVDESDQ